MELKDSIIKSPTIIYNNNNACVCWTKNLTTKGLRHIQIQENAIREAVQNSKVEVKHIAGAANLSDIFTKEEKDSTHFLLMRDTVLEVPPEKSNKSPTRSSLQSEGQNEGGDSLALKVTASEFQLTTTFVYGFCEKFKDIKAAHDKKTLE
eukprot:5800268-Ditylum_brightwellii.AAC.1